MRSKVAGINNIGRFIYFPVLFSSNNTSPLTTTAVSTSLQGTEANNACTIGFFRTRSPSNAQGYRSMLEYIMFTCFFPAAC